MFAEIAPCNGLAETCYGALEIVWATTTIYPAEIGKVETATQYVITSESTGISPSRENVETGTNQRSWS